MQDWGWYKQAKDQDADEDRHENEDTRTRRTNKTRTTMRARMRTRPMMRTTSRTKTGVRTAMKPTKQPVPLLKHQPARTQLLVAIAAQDSDNVIKHVMWINVNTANKVCK